MLQLAILILVNQGFAQPDSGASLTIRFAQGASQFHVGEAIPLELAFTASVADTYDMDTRNYDRSGRLNMEQFHVSPAGRDPLKNYFSTGIFMGGGLGGSNVLTSESATMREDLNEWVALDQPGHYTLYVTSSRVSRPGAAKSEAIALRSNSLEFDVVPADPVWQEAALNSAASVLEDLGSTDVQKAAAIRTLRFLDSPASVAELVRQMTKLPEGRRWDCVAGLAGSRRQDLVVRTLEEQMGAPDTAISGEYLRTLAKLKTDLKHEPLPPYPAAGDEQQKKEWRDRLQAQDDELTRVQDELYRTAAALLPAKQGVARAETVKALLSQPVRNPGDIKPLAGLPEAEVADAFLALSADQQWALLSTFWQRLKAPAMAAPLEKLIELPEIHNMLLRDLAVQRLYQLDPAEGAQRILQEIRNPHFIDNGAPAVKAETLALLPEATLPELDPLLASRIEEKHSPTRTLHAQLIGRSATKAILPRVKAVYEAAAHGDWDCLAADGLVRYFVRVEPDYGVRRAAQEPSSCMTNSLAEVVRIRRWKEVEPAIIVTLNNPDLNRARGAAETLAKYGTTKAQKAMWERLRSFHQQWAPRADALNSRPVMPREALDAMGFQVGLVESLGRAQAWILTNDQVTELEDLVLGSSEQDSVKHWRWHSPVNVNISFPFDEHLSAQINSQYSAGDIASLKSKLAQYPSGTTFSVTAFGPQELLAPVLREVDKVAADHGLSVERPPSSEMVIPNRFQR